MSVQQTPDVQFVNDYISAWSTTDATERRALIQKLYAPTIDFYANEPGDGPVERHGLTEMMDNITQVNGRLTQEKNLLTESTGFSVNHDVVRVSWKMTTPNGDIAMSGMNLLTRNGKGKIIRDYIFIG